eukprot:157667_1
MVEVVSATVDIVGVGIATYEEAETMIHKTNSHVVEPTKPQSTSWKCQTILIFWYIAMLIEAYDTFSDVYAWIIVVDLDVSWGELCDSTGYIGQIDTVGCSDDGWEECESHSMTDVDQIFSKMKSPKQACCPSPAYDCWCEPNWDTETYHYCEQSGVDWKMYVALFWTLGIIVVLKESMKLLWCLIISIWGQPAGIKHVVDSPFVFILTIFSPNTYDDVKNDVLNGTLNLSKCGIVCNLLLEDIPGVVLAILFTQLLNDWTVLAIMQITASGLSILRLLYRIRAINKARYIDMV